MQITEIIALITSVVIGVWTGFQEYRHRKKRQVKKVDKDLDQEKSN